MRRMATMRLVAVCMLWLGVAAQEMSSGVFKTDCMRVCGAFETCVVVDGAEACAAFCAPGRCNDAAEVCMLQAKACTSSPCLPVAVCVPKSGQIQTTSPTLSGDSSQIAATCARQCPMASSPVCGSDGVSYANSCFFEQAQCINPSLSLAYKQLCLEDVELNALYNPQLPTVAIDTTSCEKIVCSTVEDPVCTSAGTMRNVCYWKKAQCLKPSISLVSKVACDASSHMPACPTSCTQEYVPVCGSNGLIYGNECLFRMAKCQRQPFAELKAKDLSYCELQVGDSNGKASDINELLMASMASY